MAEGPVAVSVLTGFLGAGKTSLLNALLADPSLTHTAVIINEFGDVSLDHLLVEKASDDLIELADGCICCTVRGELVDTLADLLDRRQTGRLARLDRIVIETTGLADPVPVLHSLIAHPVLAQELRLDGVVTVVDAVNGNATLDRHAESVRQVAVADRLVVSKVDLASADEHARLVARLRTLNPNAAIVDRTDAASPSRLFDAGLWNPTTKSADVAAWLGDAASHDAHDHHHHHHAHHDHDHDHDHHHPHDAKVKSFSLVHADPLAWNTVEMFLDLIRSTQGEKLLRMKGIVEIEEDRDRPLVLHGVQGILHPPAWLPAWPDAQRGSRLVLIGYDLDEAYVRRLFAAFTGAQGIDQPDRQALTDNPLAVAGFS